MGILRYGKKLMDMWEEKNPGAKGARLIVMMLTVLVVLVACKSEDTAPEEPVEPEMREFPGVDERLWAYFERFEQQAAQRGVTIDLVAEGITGVITAIDEENVAGTCNFNNRTPNHVMIDEEFFNAVGDLFKEFIIFHELGHCSLFRDHLEEEDSFGRCLSIMRSGTGNCRDNYTFNSRATYINELFDPERRNDIFGH